MEGTSLNITNDLVAKLKEIIPTAFTEDKLNIAQLKQLLGDDINTDTEKYQLTWAGKSEAYKILQVPTTATLLPKLDESVNWDSAESVLIEGENLEVLKVLQRSYYGKVKMIYIDPPYNTGSDSFIYPDRFAETKEEYLKRINDKDGDGYIMKEGYFRSNRRENGQFHSNWMSMMLPRLFLARNLLRDDGVIFISIDDNEVHNLRALCNEIFGEENFVTEFVWLKRSTGGQVKNNAIIDQTESILFYAKNKENSKINRLLNPTPNSEKWRDFRKSGGQWQRGFRPNQFYPFYYNAKENILSLEEIPNSQKIIPTDSNGVEGYWENYQVTAKERLLKGELRCRLVGEKYKIEQFEVSSENINTGNFIDIPSFLGGEEAKIIFGEKVFDNPKPTALLNTLLIIGSNPNDIVLDFFAGSGTTAQAVMELNEEDGGNRKYICVQLPERCNEQSEAYKAGYRTIADITQARIKKVIEKIDNERKGTLELEAERPKLGFRKYTLIPSNFKIWRGDVLFSEEDLKEQMKVFTIPQKEGATSFDMLWEVIIKHGLPLTTEVREVKLSESEKFYVAVHDKTTLACCFDAYSEAIQAEILKLKPSLCVLLDTIFENNDCNKTNVLLKLQDNGIDFKLI